MNISSHILEAYLHCPTKCWLMSRSEVEEDNVYAEWMREKNQAYRANAIKRLSDGLQDGEFIAASPTKLNLKTASWRLASDVTAGSKELESCIHAVERTPSEGRGKPARFVPIRFVANNKLTKLDKLLVAFDAHILAETFKREITHGKIIHGDGFSTLKVKTSVLVGEMRKIVGTIRALMTGDITPDLILNRHCPECGYQGRCREKAIEKDDLTLLGGMTEKERKKLNSKGIFTVTQLSYTFRPRRRPKRLRDKKEKYHHSLKALAIREKKIHIVGSPELHIEGTPVYLDVEGLPDRDFYYLIGVRIGQGDSVVQHSLWADGPEDEERIWREFLEVLATIDKPVLIHYGSYETTFIKTMCSRYGVACNPVQTSEVFETSEVYNQNINHQTSEVLKTSEVSPEINVPTIAKTNADSNAEKTLPSAINLLSVIYGHVYFPVASNGLKEIAGYCGFQWSETLASGRKSIVWREKWEATKGIAEQEKLIRYNAEDCEALEVVTQKVLSLRHPETTTEETIEKDVVDISNQKREHPYGFKRNSFIIPEFETINQAAYWDYQRERVYMKTNPALKKSFHNAPDKSKPPVPNQIIECQRPIACPTCSSSNIWQNAKHSRITTDLKFTRYGIKRWVVKYNYQQYLCNYCGKTFISIPVKSKSKYGSELIAYSIYQCIELRTPIMTIEKGLNKLFNLNLLDGSTNKFKVNAAISYESTCKSIMNKICSGNLIHADETKISLRNDNGFVWVFANMYEVAYIYTATREGDYIQALLKDFKGVLVSDFYAAYDSINCPQQKCLIHLIRDINDALYKHPYDDGLKQLAEGFTSLLRPMIETIDRFGLKQHFLKKHLPYVDCFFKELLHLHLISEPAAKLRERFEKNRATLFTFLKYDGIPWNNNNAEHAVKPFAMLRNIIKGVTSEKGLKEYLILLSICETCKYRGLDFLDFLRSGEKDLDVFAASQRRRRRSTKNGQTSEVSKNLGGLVVPAT
jgi:predicted RecB family nuclease